MEGILHYKQITGDFIMTKKQKEWIDFEVTDICLVPQSALVFREYDAVKAVSPWIQKQIEDGVMDIPGVRIFPTTRKKHWKRKISDFYHYFVGAIL